MPISLFSACVLIIGNEILSGRTTEANLQYIAQKLVERGIDLQEARIIPDDISIIATAVRACSASYDYVFTTGGIGPTHDDVTAEAIAAAFGVSLELHPRAVHLLEQHYGKENLTKPHLKMALFPQGATLIENPFSGAPGFTLKNVSVLAGVPRIMQAMLDGFLLHIQAGSPFYSETVSCFMAESDLAEGLAAIQEKNPKATLGSYPFLYQGKIGTSLVARGRDARQVKYIKQEVCALIQELSGELIQDPPLTKSM